MHRLDLICLLRDPLPAQRVDVSVLFGKELPKLGIYSDYIGQTNVDPAPRECDWPAGKAYITGRETARMLPYAFLPFVDLFYLIKHARKAHTIVQVRDKIRSGLLALLFSRLTGRKFVYWMSFQFVEDFAVRHANTGWSRGPLVWLSNVIRSKLAPWLFYKLLTPRADYVFVQSDAMLELMAGKGIDRKRMSAVPMGFEVDLTGHRATPVVSGPMAGRRVVTYLGVLSRSRNSDFMIEVIASVRKRVPEAFLLLVGDAPNESDREWIRRRIVELGLSDHVQLTGWLPRSEAIPLILNAEVGLSPYPRGDLLDTCSPTKAVEYLALRIPCVANDNPDQSLVISRSGGGICVPMTVENFSNAVVTLLEDPQRARRMGESGHRWIIENRTYERIAQPVAATYHWLAQGAVSDPVADNTPA
jgi:glycosyltransferase involved in cell wall biosynthesis